MKWNVQLNSEQCQKRIAQTQHTKNGEKSTEMAKPFLLLLPVSLPPLWRVPLWLEQQRFLCHSCHPCVFSGAVLRFPPFFCVDFEDRVVFQMQYCWLLCLAFVAWLLDSLWQEHCFLFARFHFSSALFEFFHFYFLVSLWRFLHDYSFLFLPENLL